MPKWGFALISLAIPILVGGALQLSGYQNIPLAIALLVVAGLSILFLILTLPPVARRIPFSWLKKLVTENKAASRMYDMEMGEHITQIKSALEERKRRLQSLARNPSSKNRHAIIDKTLEFEYAQVHCPSLQGKYADMLIQVGLYELDLKRKIPIRDIKQSKAFLVNKIDSDIKAIDKSLKGHEYTKNRCGGCPRNVTASIQNNFDKYPIGESEQTKQQKAQVKSDIGVLIIEGADVLRGFKAIKAFGEAWPEEEFKIWREKVYETLTNHKLDDYYPLFFKDTCIDISQAVLSDYIGACESGLNRLEELLKSLI